MHLRYIVLTSCFVAFACSSDDKSTVVNSGLDAGETDVSLTTLGDGGTLTFAPSNKSNVRFKQTEQLRQDLMRVLSLQSSQVCQELGAFDCISEVHTVALGGVEPYISGITKPAEQTTGTAPNIIDRVVLSACLSRVDADLGNVEDAVWLTEARMPESITTSTTTRAVLVQYLYQQGLLRDPQLGERNALVDLYQTIDDNSQNTSRDWAVLSCFAVLSSLEFIFY